MKLNMKKTSSKYKASALTLLLSFCCLGYVFTGSLGYYQDNVNTNGSLTIGNVKVELHEEFPEHDEYGANTTSKKFWGENTGTMDEYIRASIITNVEIKNNDGSWAILAAVPSNAIKYDISADTKSKWVQSADDYWYYKSVVPPKGLTSKFDITNVRVDIPEEFKEKTLRINMTVSLECVQAAHEQYKLVWGLSSLPSGVQVVK